MFYMALFVLVRLGKRNYDGKPKMAIDL